MSRIQKSIANARVNMIFYVLSILLAFFSRKYFLQNLGTEFLGLSGTLGDMLNLMNITELGIGTAVAVTLYKPLFGNDRETINDIVSVFGFLYTRVGALIVFAGIVLSCFFPIIFKDAGLPLYLPYFMFYSMLYASLLGYFVNYKQIILSASQQNYVITIRYQITVIIKTLLQIAVSFLPYNYIWWISLEALTITIYSLVLNKSIYRYFPWLETSVARGKAKFKEYIHLWTRTKQVFVLKLSHLVFNSATNVLTASFANLTTVALYGNYNMLMSKVTSLFDGLFTGMEASVGNLIAEGNRSNILKVFFELLCIRYFIAGLCSITLYFTVSPFISVWLGSEYIMSELIIILLSFHVFIQQARLTVDNFKNGYGIYDDVWAPIAEVIIFLGLAVVLGYFYGLAGILTGMVTSELLIKMFWKPYYLFKKGFDASVLSHYWPIVLKYFVAFALCIICTSFISIKYKDMFDVSGWLMILVYCVAMGLSVLVTLSILFLIFDKSFLGFAQRLLNYFKK